MTTKTNNRRDFLKTAGSAAALGCFLPLRNLGQDLLGPHSSKELKILIMGGTGFLGPAVVAALKARGHEITLFNRGRTRPNLFPELEKLRGDRNRDLSALKGRKWDGVIDNCGYHPSQIRKSTQALKTSSFYLFVSTVSVYEQGSKMDTHENSPLGTIENPEKARVTNDTYGPLKALCEKATTKAFPKNSVIVRPGLIVGPGDPTDRFTYWPARVARGSELLAPGNPQWGTQYIDVRDLAMWMVHLCEKRITGTYNAVGPKSPTPFGDLLESCKRVSKSDATFRWMSVPFMKTNKVTAWGDMPAYVNPPQGMTRPARYANSAAVGAGLVFRPLDETVAATLEFHKSRGEDYKIRTGIHVEKEKRILKIWHQDQAKKPAKK